MIETLPCLDSDAHALARRDDLLVPRHYARELGNSAVEVIATGTCTVAGGRQVEIGAALQRARAAKVSIAPGAVLPDADPASEPVTRVQVANETTLQAAQRLTRAGLRPLSLNFANGVHPGGGFLGGARAQEEVLCRSSGLYTTLAGDAMYSEHAKRTLPDSTDWAIYSPSVPVFRHDGGTPVGAVWQADFITCAAPYAPGVGQPLSGDLLARRIRRVLAIAAAHGYRALVLGAWGCGAFHNDPDRTARDFRVAIENDFSGAFSEVVFAICDWSAERRMLGPFRDVFA